MQYGENTRMKIDKLIAKFQEVGPLLLSFKTSMKKLNPSHKNFKGFDRIESCVTNAHV
jgi:hypothetical protein